jgi:hypothetical protein
MITQEQKSLNYLHLGDLTGLSIEQGLTMHDHKMSLFEAWLDLTRLVLEKLEDLEVS